MSDPTPSYAPSEAGSLVRSELAGGVATITLDSPHNRNALSQRLQGELKRSLTAALTDDRVRVVVLTGAGSVFCSGGDLKEKPAGPELMIDILTTLWHSSKPVVCRVNGPARAGGLGLIAACDIAVAPTTASFAFAEVRIGVLPAIIAVPCLARIAPRAALELFLTGDAFDAARAAEIGLLTRTVDPEDLDAAVGRLTGSLQAGGPRALAGIKPMIRRVAELDLADGLAEMGALSMSYFSSPEAEEGVRSFREKRAPAWVVSR